MISKGEIGMKKHRIYWLAATMAVLLLSGCTKHVVETKSQVEVAPVEIKPIHITIDINIKVDRALDDFFGDLDKKAAQEKK